ncbi:MAG: hypothetical protein M3O31_14880 [Acidobacteriota bacterium]|nr:hypothetical protein [Acidobacteriota bacterium]
MAVLMVAALRMQAQADGQVGGPGAGQGQGRGGGFGQRGGFGGGRPVQGIVTAASANKLTIKTDGGDSYDITLVENARIVENRQPIQLGDIKAGDSVTAMGQVDAIKKTVQAMMVNATDAATVAKAKENLGKTYITGRITAIDADNLKITVMRRDTVSQVIAVDDGTSFQRGNGGVQADVAAAGGLAMGGGFGGRGGNRQGGAGAQAASPAPESITLADIKVGDVVMATGALKGGTFTVLKMGVSEPGMGLGAGQGGARQRPTPGTVPGQAAPPTPPQ